MKKFLLAASVLLVGMVGSASAAPFTWTDTINFTPDILIPPTYSYFHDIGDGPDGFASFLDGGNDTISSFELQLAVYDDNLSSTERQLKWVNWSLQWVNVVKPDGTENGGVTFGLGFYPLTFGSGANTYTGNFGGTVDIFHDGTLNVSVFSTGGDFYLDSSRLVVNGDNGTAPVPEPGTLLLMGTGLAGLVAVRRRKTRKA